MDSAGVRSPIETDASGRGTTTEFRIPFPPRQTLYTEEEIAIVAEVMRNAEAQTQGKRLKQFEADFAAYNGSRHAFAVDNCTNALTLAATLCQLKPEDEVIIPAHTFCATAIPFARMARIVWADIDPDLRVVTAETVAAKLTPCTKAMVVVHLYGLPAPMGPIMELARDHRLFVVEDCAQAIGAAYHDQKVGSFGDFGCFSLHGAKNVTTLGEGGVLTANRARFDINHSDELAARLPGLRHNGVRAFDADRPRYWLPAMSNVDLDLEGVVPFNFCLGEAQCALGSALLKRVEAIAANHQEQADCMRGRLVGYPLSFQKVPSGHKHVYHLLSARYDGAGGRDAFIERMAFHHGVRMIVQYYPLYRYPLFQRLGLGEHDCPETDRFFDNMVSFPWWTDMPKAALDSMIDATKETCDTLAGGR